MNYKISTEPGAKLRIDKWSWAERFFKTRSLASGAVEKGRVKIGGANVKPSKYVRVGDIVEIDIERLVWQVEVLGVCDVRADALFGNRGRTRTRETARRSRTAQDVPQTRRRHAGQADEAGPSDHRQIFRSGLK